MKKAMIVTVGTGKGVEHGIAVSIEDKHPDFIAFLVTKKSEATITEVEKELKQEFQPEKHIVKMIENEKDAEESYLLAKEVIEELKERDYKDICVDFTSGTKAMTGGLILAAVAEETPSLVYIAGKRDEKTGRVISGTERVYTIPSPIKILSDAKKKLLMKMFSRYQFDECLKIIEDVKSKTSDESVLKDFNVLEKLAKGYSHWDKFDHKEALNLLRTHDNSLLNIERNKNFLLKMEKNDYGSHKDLIPDLLNNVARRMKEGKYDDAVARLYRITELIAQYKLKEKSIDSRDVDVRWLQCGLGMDKELVEKYEKLKDEKGKIKLGLRKGFELLCDLNVGIGKKFMEDNKMRGMLENRNNSILAHGLKPVEKADAEKMFEKVKEYVEEVFTDISNLTKDSEFPKF